MPLSARKAGERAQGGRTTRESGEVVLKSAADLEAMREGGRILRRALEAVRELIRPGIDTLTLDRVAEDVVRSHGGRPSFLGLYGFPRSICASVNDVVVHGIPSPDVVLREGDIVGIDLGVEYGGLHVDGAETFIVGEVDKQVRELVLRTREALELAIAACQPGRRVRDISWAIQRYIEQVHGFSCVRALCGHGVGFAVHEAPQVPNVVGKEPGPELVPGMTLAIEPMVNMGSYEVYTDDDGWAVRTRDGKPSAHFEHTVAITEEGPEVLTR